MICDTAKSKADGVLQPSRQMHAQAALVRSELECVADGDRCRGTWSINVATLHFQKIRRLLVYWGCPKRLANCMLT